MRAQEFTENEVPNTWDETGGPKDQKLADTILKKYGADKTKVILDFAQLFTDGGEEIMKDRGLTYHDAGWMKTKKNFLKNIHGYQQ